MADIKLTRPAAGQNVVVPSAPDARMVLDFSPETARAVATAALKREPADEDEIHYVMMEFVNLVGGHGVSRLNRSFKELGLRVALPGLFFLQNLSLMPLRLDCN